VAGTQPIRNTSPRSTQARPDPRLILATDLDSAFLCTKAALPGMPDSVSTSTCEARTVPANPCHSETNIRTIAMPFLLATLHVPGAYTKRAGNFMHPSGQCDSP